MKNYGWVLSGCVLQQRNWVAKSNFGLSCFGQLLILQEELLVKKGVAASCSETGVSKPYYGFIRNC